MRPFPELTAAHASLIGSLLRDKSARDAERAFVLEGVKPIREALDARATLLRTLVVTPAFLNTCDASFMARLHARHRLVSLCHGRAFQKLADVVTSAGILAVLEQPEWDLATIVRRGRLLGLYGESLQDPTNVGPIIRTAAGLGLDAMWLSKDSVDVFNPKVVRATAGLVLHLPIFRVPSATIFREHGCALLAAQPEGRESRPISAVASPPRRAILAFGNESRGLSAATLEQAAVRFHIPTAHAVESLNVSASAAIAMFYFRHLAGRGREDGTPASRRR